MTRWLVALLAIASVGVTALIAMVALRPTTSATPAGQVLSGGVVNDDRAENPPKLLQLPAFELTERNGDRVALADLKGKTWIASFIFTRCAGPCPMMTARTAMLQTDLRKKSYWDKLRLVTITVDPDHDTPAVLAERAQSVDADKTHWLWLTGPGTNPRPAVWSLVRDGFKLPVNEDAKTVAMPIMHSQKFVLVDGEGWIRGFYDALEQDDYAALLADVQRVTAKP